MVRRPSRRTVRPVLRRSESVRRRFPQLGQELRHHGNMLRVDVLEGAGGLSGHAVPEPLAYYAKPNGVTSISSVFVTNNINTHRDTDFETKSRLLDLQVAYVTSARRSDDMHER